MLTQTPIDLHHGVAFGIPVGASVVLSLSLLSFVAKAEPMTPTLPTTPERPLMRGDLETSLKILFLDAIEGGFSDHPHDPGGPTNHGLSLRAVSLLDADRRLTPFLKDRLDKDDDGDVDVHDVKAWTREDTIDFYRQEYWNKIRGAELPAQLAVVTFDSAVNEGVPTAIPHLQRALGVKVDGVIGPDTLAAADSATRMLFRAGNQRELIAEMTSRRLQRYRGLARAETFFRGWARRSVLVAIHADAMKVEAE